MNYLMNGLASGALVSAFVFSAYLLIRLVKNFSASDRLLFLKLGFLAMLLVPLCPSVFSGARIFSVSQVVEIQPQLQWIQKNIVVSSSAVSTEPAPTFPIILSFYLFILAILLGRLFISFLKLYLFAGEGVPVSTASRYPVLLHPLDFPPATIGFFRPIILIPAKIYEGLSVEQLSLVLRHEEVHIRRQDWAFNIIVRLLQATLFFSPFVYFLSKWFQEDLELSCDEEILRENAKVTKSYGGLLLDLVTQTALRSDLNPSGLFVSNSLITRRIEAMKNTTKQKKQFLTYGIFAIALALSYVSNSALGLSPNPELVMNQDMLLKVRVKVDTEKGPGKVKAEATLGINYGESKEILAGGNRFMITLSRTLGDTVVEVSVFDQGNNKIHSSTLPFNGKAGFEAKVEANSYGIYEVAASIERI